MFKTPFSKLMQIFLKILQSVFFKQIIIIMLKVYKWSDLIKSMIHPEVITKNVSKYLKDSCYAIHILGVEIWLK
jgi:hypothetical protein